ncbi:MAG: lysine 2,3-aminomutase [Halobacteriovoraceae bacterium]|nr:lysine 2,3-aminomutase [Halobacteriovoraceae bacterium]|tara:strand:- start:2300 stop:3343 length:1044 start_codon:yes stop_codon:yes gene_type:complete
MQPSLAPTIEHISWQQEFRDALKSSEEIKAYFNLEQVSTHYSGFIPKKFAEKIKDSGPNSPLAKQFIPQALEDDLKLGKLDPIGDIEHSQQNGIIHRYKNRILFTPTTVCPVHCRYCFRKNELSQNHSIYKQSIDKLIHYLKKHQEVEEVILTGGDPLILSNKKLAELFNALTQTHISYVRIHTRTPIILPSRIDEGLMEVLEKASRSLTRILFFLHTNHRDEIDDEVQKSLQKLSRLNIDTRTQTVLLKEVNDSADQLKELFDKVIQCGFSPYYLHHPDKVKGAMHFYLELEEGRRVYAQLRDILPGWALPHYVIDGPHGKSLAFNPESFDFQGQLIDKDGHLRDY